MKYLFFIFFIFYLKSAFSWSFEELNIFFEGCVEERQALSYSGDNDWYRGENYEFCGCSTNGVSKNFSVSDILELYETQSVASNRTIIKIASDCMDKIGR